MPIHRILLLACAGSAIIAAPPALAHHSGAMFDASKDVTVSGTVTAWEFTAPHSWLHIVLPQADGKLQQWSFEGGGPSSAGPFRKDTFTVGDKVSVKTHPMKDGRPAGSMMEVTFADGRKLRMGPPPGGPPGPPPAGAPGPG